MKKKLSIWNILILGSLLTSCEVVYSRPITQEAAKNIIQYTSSAIDQRDFGTLNTISYVSKLREYRMASFIGRELFLDAEYTFKYQRDPYSLKIDGKFDTNSSKEVKYSNFSLEITKTDTTYLVTQDGVTSDISDEKYADYKQFCDFSSYIKNISRKLISKASSLIESVGYETDSKDNKLEGFQTSSKAGDDLEIGYTGREFEAKECFFEKEYNQETATSLKLHMSSGVITSYSSEYTFTLNEEDDYYEAGTYEGKIENYLSYNE